MLGSSSLHRPLKYNYLHITVTITAEAKSTITGPEWNHNNWCWVKENRIRLMKIFLAFPYSFIWSIYVNRAMPANFRKLVHFHQKGFILYFTQKWFLPLSVEVIRMAKTPQFKNWWFCHFQANLQFGGNRNFRITRADIYHIWRSLFVGIWSTELNDKDPRKSLYM